MSSDRRRGHVQPWRGDSALSVALRVARVAGVVLATLICGGGCADFSRGDSRVDASADDSVGTDATGATDGGAPPTFAAAIHPLLIAGCGDCHGNGGEAGDTAFVLAGEAAVDLTATRTFIAPEAPGSSRLLAKMAGRGHGGGAVHTDTTPEYALTLRWIEGGALP